MTFSIVARCAETGMLGVAIACALPATAARCIVARAGVGAMASQNIADPSLGRRCLDLMQQGASATQALEIIKGSANHLDYRQVVAVDRQGRTAGFSGRHTSGRSSVFHGAEAACAGNDLARADIPEIMVQAFQDSAGPLGDRLLIAMASARAGGGGGEPLHSAGLLLVDQVSWPVADLRIDWDEAADPIAGLQRLWDVYAPRLQEDLLGAINPAALHTRGGAGTPSRAVGRAPTSLLRRNPG